MTITTGGSTVNDGLGEQQSFLGSLGHLQNQPTLTINQQKGSQNWRETNNLEFKKRRINCLQNTLNLSRYSFLSAAADCRKVGRQVSSPRSLLHKGRSLANSTGPFHKLGPRPDFPLDLTRPTTSSPTAAQQTDGHFAANRPQSRGTFTLNQASIPRRLGQQTKATILQRARRLEMNLPADI